MQEPGHVLLLLPLLLFSLPVFSYIVYLRQETAVALAQCGGGGHFCILGVEIFLTALLSITASYE